MIFVNTFMAHRVYNRISRDVQLYVVPSHVIDVFDNSEWFGVTL